MATDDPQPDSPQPDHPQQDPAPPDHTALEAHEQDGPRRDRQQQDGRQRDGQRQDGWIEIDDGPTRWRFERSFLTSRWSCIWGSGCLGIEPEPDGTSLLGCCSVGAELATEDEARLISAMAAMIDPERFQHHARAQRDGIFSDDSRTNTKVVDGACIFLNRGGFAGGEGCALHLAAIDAGEPPIEWKPSVCWQLPIKVDWVALEGNPASGSPVETATVRRWSRADWGEIGETMAWCCTEGDRAYQGEAEVIDSLAEELAEVVGPEVYVELRTRLGRAARPPSARS